MLHGTGWGSPNAAWECGKPSVMVPFWGIPTSMEWYSRVGKLQPAVKFGPLLASCCFFGFGFGFVSTAHEIRMVSTFLNN